MSGVLLSKEFGVNPSVTQCFYCGEDSGVALFGAGFKKKDERGNLVTAEAPRCVGVLDMVPCTKCEGYMKQGIILISVKDESLATLPEERAAHAREMDKHPEKYRRPFIPNPYRTGGFWVIKEDAIKRMLADGPLKELVLKHRWTFIEDSTAKEVGLIKPEENTNANIESDK